MARNYSPDTPISVIAQEQSRDLNAHFFIDRRVFLRRMFDILAAWQHTHAPQLDQALDDLIALVIRDWWFSIRREHHDDDTRSISFTNVIYVEHGVIRPAMTVQAYCDWIMQTRGVPSHIAFSQEWSKSQQMDVSLVILGHRGQWDFPILSVEDIL